MVFGLELLGKRFLIFALLILLFGSVLASDESDAGDELEAVEAVEELETTSVVSAPIVTPAPLAPGDTGFGVAAY